MILFNNIRNAGQEASKANLHPCRLLTQWALYKKDHSTGRYDTSRVDKDTILNCIKIIGNDNRLVVLDFEDWPLQGSADVIQETMYKMLEAVDIFREYAPGLRLGIYPVPPRTSWHAVYNWYKFKKDKTSKWYGEAKKVYKWWSGQNSLYAKGKRKNYHYECVVDHVDFICPDIYIPYNTDDALKFWPIFGREHIKIARKHKKNVYPYISPYLQAKDKTLLPTKSWIKMLDTCKKYADGAIIYTAVDLDPNIEWWVATKEWIANNSV